MPIYEYRCEACGSVMEKIQSFSAPPPDACESCGGGPMHKLISQSSFVLKGGGWYKDGYASTSSSVGSDSGSESSTSSGVSSSSDSSSSSSSSDSSSSSSSSSASASDA
ncbi:MAG: zinc ribbon domain-containing protein [Deltaproteobacteria bacterium]|nr:MAG: zinc ribbon domain-containing protein [Deltaproteobacteria bacterium]